MDKIGNKLEVLNIQENCLSLEDMPNEILANIISYLDRVDIKDILIELSLMRTSTAHVSKRMLAICLNISTWEKMNLFKKKVPSEFLQIVIENGCKYLSLYRTEITGNLKSIKASDLKYLDLTQGTSINDVRYQGRQGGPRQPPKSDVIEQEKVGRQVKNGQKTWDVINGRSLCIFTYHPVEGAQHQKKTDGFSKKVPFS